MLILTDMHWGLWYKGLLLEKPCLGFLRLQLGEAGGILVDFPTAEKAAAIEDPYQWIPVDLDLCPLRFPLK